MDATTAELSTQTEQLRQDPLDEPSSFTSAKEHSSTAAACKKEEALVPRTIDDLPTEIRQRMFTLATAYQGCALSDGKTYIDLAQAVRICLAHPIFLQDVEDMLRSLLAREELKAAQDLNGRPQRCPGCRRRALNSHCQFHRHFFSHGHYTSDMRELSSLLTTCLEDWGPKKGTEWDEGHYKKVSRVLSLAKVAVEDHKHLGAANTLLNKLRRSRPTLQLSEKTVPATWDTVLDELRDMRVRIAKDREHAGFWPSDAELESNAHAKV